MYSDDEWANFWFFFPRQPHMLINTYGARAHMENSWNSISLCDINSRRNHFEMSLIFSYVYEYRYWWEISRKALLNLVSNFWNISRFLFVLMFLWICLINQTCPFQYFISFFPGMYSTLFNQQQMTLYRLLLNKNKALLMMTSDLIRIRTAHFT